MGCSILVQSLPLSGGWIRQSVQGLIIGTFRSPLLSPLEGVGTTILGVWRPRLSEKIDVFSFPGQCSYPFCSHRNNVGGRGKESPYRQKHVGRWALTGAICERNFWWARSLSWFLCLKKFPTCEAIHLSSLWGLQTLTFMGSVWGKKNKNKNKTTRKGRPEVSYCYKRFYIYFISKVLGCFGPCLAIGSLRSGSGSCSIFSFSLMYFILQYIFEPDPLNIFYWIDQVDMVSALRKFISNQEIIRIQWLMMESIKHIEQWSTVEYYYLAKKRMKSCHLQQAGWTLRALC